MVADQRLPLRVRETQGLLLLPCGSLQLVTFVN